MAAIKECRCTFFSQPSYCLALTPFYWFLFSNLKINLHTENFDRKSDVMHHFSRVNANHREPRDRDIRRPHCQHLQHGQTVCLRYLSSIVANSHSNTTSFALRCSALINCTNTELLVLMQPPGNSRPDTVAESHFHSLKVNASTFIQLSAQHLALRRLSLSTTRVQVELKESPR